MDLYTADDLAAREATRRETTGQLQDWEYRAFIRPGWTVEWSRREGCWMTAFHPVIGLPRGPMTEAEFDAYAHGITDWANHL